VGSFNNKVDRCLDRVYLHLGLPKATTFYKKYLLSKHNMKDGLFDLGGRVECFDVEDTYLVCKKPNGEEKVSRRGQKDSYLYTYSIQYLEKTETIKQKRQISAREYMKLIDNADDRMKILKKKKQCFLYKKK
jgi:hypothetical protein